ncbi:MAG: N-formylglutamate amidohydrolase [Akkermansia sp.]
MQQILFEQQDGKGENSPLILHIPHASQHIPKECAASFLLPPQELRDELLRMTDHFTDELFTCQTATRICYPVSRLVLDVERFANDEQEHMSQIGMGVIYTKSSHLTELRTPPTPQEREYLLSRYYYPHHEQVQKSCEDALTQHQHCLIIDCHSFPTQSLPYERQIHGELHRPQICIGSDDYHTSSALLENCVQSFRKRGYEVAINTPFAGALVPMKYYQKNAAVQSLMIELRRDLYMDEETGDKNAHFTSLQTDIRDILRELI